MISTLETNPFAPEPAMALDQWAHHAFSKHGSMSASKSFEYRQEQQDLAIAVAKSLKTSKPLVAEAGTGVGKSLAYLMPAVQFALETGRKAVISTHTIHLQEQLVRKDIPIVRQLIDREVASVLLKGRQNYLCPQRLKRALEQTDDLFSSSENDQLLTIKKWAESTTNGTLSDLPFQPSMKIWLQVCSEAHSCTSKLCGPRGNCFFQEAKKAASEANIIVVNHTLFFALLNQDIPAEPEHSNIGGFLFPNDFAILDEAHTIEQIAAVQLGLRVSQASLKFDIQRLYNPQSKKGTLKIYRRSSVFDRVERALAASEQFFEELGENCQFNSISKEKRIRQPSLVNNTIAAPLRELWEEIETIASDLDTEIHKNELLDASRKLKETNHAIATFLDQTQDQHVYWVEKQNQHEYTQYTLQAAPIHVADRLRPLLFEGNKNIILTSATLAIGDPSLKYFCKRIGAEQAQTLHIGSPFDYRKQMRIQIYQNMPEPNQPNYEAQLALGIQHALTITHGHAFVLFTSYRLMKSISEKLHRFLSEKNWKLFLQGDGTPRHQMIESFRRTKNAVLFGTDSFWTGVDVPGEALSNVIVTRLPFAVPDHPLIASRLENIEHHGGNPFMEYSVPEAILKLRQGVGRLIRSKKDHGYVCILDPRILTKKYGKSFLNAMPEAPVEIIKTLD